MHLSSHVRIFKRVYNSWRSYYFFKVSRKSSQLPMSLFTVQGVKTSTIHLLGRRTAYGNFLLHSLESSSFEGILKHIILSLLSFSKIIKEINILSPSVFPVEGAEALHNLLLGS